MPDNVRAAFLNDFADLLKKHNVNINDEGYNYLEFWCGEKYLVTIPSRENIDFQTIEKMIDKMKKGKLK